MGRPPRKGFDSVLVMFYREQMREKVSCALQEHLRAQLGVMRECRRRADAARDPRLAFAWVETILRFCQGPAEIGSLLGSLEGKSELEQMTALMLANLRLPQLPEGDPPPTNGKTTSGRMYSENSQLEHLGAGAPLSSPAWGGGADPACNWPPNGSKQQRSGQLLAGEAEGALAFA